MNDPCNLMNQKVPSLTASFAGSGKTTLLNALALRLRAGEGTLTGSISLNGQPHAHLLPPLSAYVSCFPAGSTLLVQRL